jgi:hypothetical protein
MLGAAAGGRGDVYMTVVTPDANSFRRSEGQVTRGAQAQAEVTSVRFLDQYLPPKVAGVGWVSMPVTKTTIISNFGGNESSNQDWEHPKLKFLAPEAIARDWDVVSGADAALADHARPSPHLADPRSARLRQRELVKPNVRSRRRRRPTRRSGPATASPSAFQLVKTYTLGAESYAAADRVAGALNRHGRDRRAGGRSRRLHGEPTWRVVQFADPPDAGAAITAGFLFDVNVRFESDDALAPVLRAHHVAGFAEMTLIETRVC